MCRRHVDESLNSVPAVPVTLLFFLVRGPDQSNHALGRRIEHLRQHDGEVLLFEIKRGRMRFDVLLSD